MASRWVVGEKQIGHASDSQLQNGHRYAAVFACGVYTPRHLGLDTSTRRF